jgi:predicted dehydrogenase
VTGLQITEVCAELTTFHKTRKRPQGSVETFSSAVSRAYVETPISTEDFGTMMFHLGETARGAMTVSQVSSGCKNRLVLEIYGTKAGVRWNAEQPDSLWIGHRDRPNEILIKNPALMHEDARNFADLPGGHSEGYDDTFKQTFKRFYARVAGPGAAIDYPTFEDGLRQLRIVEAVLESSGKRAWTAVNR